MKRRSRSKLQLARLDDRGAPATLSQSSLLVALAVEAGQPPPKEFRIFQAGLNRTSKGAFIFDETSAKSVMEAAEDQGNEFPLDYAHAMMDAFQLDPAEANKAAGWFKPEVRDGELWATQVSWTPPAAQKLSNREYRYHSPTFFHDEAGVVKTLVNVALTNRPATKHQKPLMASQTREAATHGDDKMDKKLLCALLGLAETASEQEIQAAITKLRSSTGGSAALTALTGKATEAEQVAVLTAWKDGHAQAAALSQEVATIKAAQKTARMTALLDQGVKEGKIAPAAREQFSKLFAEPEQLETYLSLAVPATVTTPGPTEKPAHAAGVAALTAEDRDIARLMGNKPEEIEKLKAKLGGVIPVGEPKQPKA